jgi:hypothetical protein
MENSGLAHRCGWAFPKLLHCSQLRGGTGIPLLITRFLETKTDLWGTPRAILWAKVSPLHDAIAIDKKIIGTNILCVPLEYRIGGNPHRSEKWPDRRMSISCKIICTKLEAIKAWVICENINPSFAPFQTSRIIRSLSSYPNVRKPPKFISP